MTTTNIRATNTCVTCGSREFINMDCCFVIHLLVRHIVVVIGYEFFVFFVLLAPAPALFFRLLPLPLPLPLSASAIATGTATAIAIAIAITTATATDPSTVGVLCWCILDFTVSPPGCGTAGLACEWMYRFRQSRGVKGWYLVGTKVPMVRRRVVSGRHRIVTQPEFCAGAFWISR